MASVLITGTSVGIGMETALELARGGHRVYATMRSPERSPELGAIVAAEGLPVTIHVLDVDSDASVAEAIGGIYASGGEIDVLVNNAGVERMGTVEEAPLDHFRLCMETNYFGAIRCIQAVLPKMRERGSGVIVNVTSVAGRIASGSMTPYVASKFAFEALSECLAQEVKAMGIRVAIVEPGIIDTRMAQNVTKVDVESKYPQGRRMSALFVEALKMGNGPSIIAKKVREVIENEDWTLRHPTGPDAAPFLGWRAGMTDEAWVNYGAQSDEEWLEQVGRDFGMTPKLL
ncbi:MAG: SDR family oxidoreductase [Acidobacteria bacterium]|nr:SDR family oxidoreductase [Acidobacteriota bacterium]